MTRWAGLSVGTQSAGELWIFGYGSLMWKPGFDFEVAARARLSGWRRCFCIYSTHHRGTAERPGLVLGLDRGGVCEGVALRVAIDKAAATLAYLRAREQVNGVYREVLMPVHLEAPWQREVMARAYVVERAHPSYTGRLPIARQARLIRAARGISGCNLDYLLNTLAHLAELAIDEPDLERIATLAGPHFARLRRGPAVSGTGGRAASGMSERAASSMGERDGARALRAVCAARDAVVAPRMRPGDRRRFIHRRQLALLAERALTVPPESAR